MLKSAHPGFVLKWDWMKPLNLSSYRLAKELGVSLPTVNDIVRQRRNVTAEMALRLARYFSTTPEFWLDIQSRYDLAVAKRKLVHKIKRIQRSSAEK